MCESDVSGRSRDLSMMENRRTNESLCESSGDSADPPTGQEKAADSMVQKQDLGGIHGFIRRDEQVVELYKKLLSEATLVFYDKQTANRLLSTQLLVRLVGRLAFVPSVGDIQAIVDKLHVPSPKRGGVDAVITDLDPKVPKLMDFLRSRSLRPGFEKLPIVPVIVVVDPIDPRLEILASALQSGVDAVLRRPLNEFAVVSYVGEVLRRHANVESIYKDVVGEVQAFNYPRFLLKGFHFFGGGKGDLSDGEGNGSFGESLDDTVRIYTRQNSESLAEDDNALGRSDSAQDISTRKTGASENISPTKETSPLVRPLKPLASVGTAGEDKSGCLAGVSQELRDSTDSGSSDVDTVASSRGGHVNISSPRLRPRLYLSPKSKGITRGGDMKDRKALVPEAACMLGDDKWQVSHELAPFVKRKAPSIVNPPTSTSSGLDKAHLAQTMRLAEKAFVFTKGQNFKTKRISDASGSQGRQTAKRPGLFCEVARGRDRDLTEIATTAGLRGVLGIVATEEVAAKAVLGRWVRKNHDRWYAISDRNGGNNLEYDARSAEKGGRLDPSRRAAVGFIHRTVPQTKKEKHAKSCCNALVTADCDGTRLMSRGGGEDRKNPSLSKGPGSGSGSGGSRDGDAGGVFKTTLSYMAKDRLREGLNEIKTNPVDVLRHTYVEVEPSRHVSAAVRCHLVKGWEENKNGRLQRALGHYRRAVATEPENTEALFFKAVVSAQLGEQFDALKDFSAAINYSLAKLNRIKERRNSDFLTVDRAGEPSGVGLGSFYFNRASVHVCLGDDASALDDLDCAVAKDTLNISYRTNRALILRRVGDYRGAQQDYSYIRALKPDGQKMERINSERYASMGKGRTTGPRSTSGDFTKRPSTAPDRRGVVVDAATGDRGRSSQMMDVDGKTNVFEKRFAETLYEGTKMEAEQDETVATIEGALQDKGRRISFSPAHRLEVRRARLPVPIDGAANIRSSSTAADTVKPRVFVRDGGRCAGTPHALNESPCTDNVNVDCVDTRGRPRVYGDEEDSMSFAEWGRTLPSHVGAASRTPRDGSRARQSPCTEIDIGADDREEPQPPRSAVLEKRILGNDENSTAVKPSEHVYATQQSSGASQGAGAACTGWSTQFRDKPLLENGVQRDALLQGLASTTRHGVGLGIERVRGVNPIREATIEEAGAKAVDKLAASCLRPRRRRESRNAVTLQEFKASIGFSAKTGLFEEIFCRPTHLDKALTTEPGQRTTEQLSHVVQAIRASPALIGLSEDTLIEMAEIVEYRVLERTAPALLQGEETDVMAMILSGRVAVQLRRKDLSFVTCDQLGPGDTFGEFCMLDELRTSRANAHGRRKSRRNALVMTSVLDRNFAAGQDTRVKNERRGSVAGASSATAFGRSMETYQALEPTQLILILKDDFFRISGLLAHRIQALKRRFDAIRKCGLFDQWNKEDLMRLARMSRVKRHPSKSVIVRQQKEPSHLHIVLSGTCTVTKYPDRLAAVQRKISEIDAALYHIKSKYTYHREVRPKIEAGTKRNTPHPATKKNKRSGGCEGAGERGKSAGGGDEGTFVAKRMSRNTDSFYGGAESTHITKTEARKVELELEMRRWRRALALIRREGGDAVIDTYKVAMLQHPQFFGEMCLLAPDGGKALGTISTNTIVETVSVSKYVMQTFYITDVFLQHVRHKAVIYPEDIKLAKMVGEDRWWEGRRRELVLETLIGPAAAKSGASVSGACGPHKNQKLIRKHPKRPGTVK